MEATDADAVRAGFASLSASSLRSRFFSPVPRLTSALLDDLTAVRPNQIVLLAFERSTGHLAGGARAIRLRDDPVAADLAVTVGDAFQGVGLGSALVRRLRRAAGSDGIERFSGHVLVDNAAARALLRRAGATAALDEPGVLRFEIRIASARGEGHLPLATTARDGSGRCGSGRRLAGAAPGGGRAEPAA
jgi:RimJ/RimL family protein N-acetyltransferase